MYKPSMAYPTESRNKVDEILVITTNVELDSIVPLKIGDRIPDKLWNMEFSTVNADSDELQYVSLGDFRDMLIILDFWATWCGPCVTSLHKLNTLQQEFANDLVVFPTSYEARDKVYEFFKSKGWSLSTAFDETLLKKYFPYSTIPHQVWIKNGKVLASIGPEYASRENIASIISGEDVKMHMKDQQRRDINNRDKLFEDGLLYKSSISKRDPTKATNLVRNKNGIVINNMDMPQLFRQAYSDFLPITGYLNRMVFEIPDSVRAKILGTGLSLTGEYENDRRYHDWLANNTYCYSIWFKEEVASDVLRQYLAADLNNFFRLHLGIVAQVEYRETECLVLEKIADIRRPTNPAYKDQKKSFRNTDRFVYSMQYVNYDISTPIVHGLKDVGDFEILISSDLTDIFGVNKELEVYGLQLTRKPWTIPLLVFSEVSKAPSKT